MSNKLKFGELTPLQKKTIKIVSISLIVGIIGVEVFGVKPLQKWHLAASETFCPSVDSGFVKNTNKLLEELIKLQDTNIHPHSLNSLNDRYEALRFDAPYTEEQVLDIQTIDVRLVEINEKYVRENCSGKLVRFYENSILSKLLDDQKEHLGIAYFSITFKQKIEQNDTFFVINDITLNRSLLRLSLDNNTWTGTILANDNSLFPENEYCFLSWKNNVIPISTRNEGNECVLRAKKDGYLYQGDADNPILQNWLPLANAYRQGNTQLSINIEYTDGTGTLYIKHKDGNIQLKCNNISCRVYSTGEEPDTLFSTTPGDPWEEFYYSDTNDLKIAIYDEGNRNKITEMIISRNNPLTLLSGLVHTNAGTQRYIINEHLVDRFSYQVTKDLSSELGLHNYSDTVRLSLDPVLSSYLQHELETYANSLSVNQDSGCLELSLTMMDMATGNILAMPYYRSSDKNINQEIRLSRKNPAMTRRYIGSTFKPLLTLASVLTCPVLLDENRMNYSWGDSSSSTFFGKTVTSWSEKSQWNPNLSMTQYLGLSNDVYPVALMALALKDGNTNLCDSTQKNNIFYTTGKKELHYWKSSDNKFTWQNQDLIKKLDMLYGLPGENINEQHYDSTRLEYYLWRHLEDTTAKLFTNGNVILSSRP